MSRSNVRDMTEGFIPKQIIEFALPLMVGNVFQMLYNTVDSIVVGKFVSTEALAAVGSTTMIVNMLVFFFNGFSVGAGVVIGQFFGAKNLKRLHDAVETAIMATFLLSVAFTLVGLGMVKPMLALMDTPESVLQDATTYLRIYFGGITGLLIYNMGSGILRAVGDTKRPLYFLIFTSVLNIIFDLLFVLIFHAGIEGVAYATILAQFISAILTLMLLTRTKEIYRLSWKELCLDKPILAQIFSVGIPAGIQSVITSVSNVFVQSYINSFGPGCMAGWSCYNKLDQFALLPMQSMSMAATTFVSQNVGARKEKRADQGVIIDVLMSSSVVLVVLVFLMIFAGPAVGLFTDDPEVIQYGSLFVMTNNPFLIVSSFNFIVAGALRGHGDSKGPMFIMISTFVGVRQLYLYVVTHFISNSARTVGLSYPAGWSACFIVMLIYYLIRRKQFMATEQPSEP